MELKELEEGYDFEVHEEKEEDAKEEDTKEEMVEDTGSGVQLSVSVNTKCLIYILSVQFPIQSISLNMEYSSTSNFANKDLFHPVFI